MPEIRTITKCTLSFSQGYQAELLSVTVAGVPSMHISFDFIPELLNMPQLEKQVCQLRFDFCLCLPRSILGSMLFVLSGAEKPCQCTSALAVSRNVMSCQHSCDS